MKTLRFPNILEAAGLEVDFRRLELPDNLEVVHGPLLEAAVEEMAELERGVHVNTHEDRQVGHYWLRNPEDAPKGVSAVVTKTWDELQKFVDENLAESSRRFDAVLWIGIGGSALGPQMVDHALRTSPSQSKMFFFDNTDPDGFKRTLDEIKASCGLTKTLVIVVSKSGSTKETNIGKEAARQAFADAGVSFERQAIAITVENSKLDQEAASWKGRFHIWDWVGGRTSLFSAVGLLPVMVTESPWREFRDGAKAMDDATRCGRLSENAALSLAVAWHHMVQARGLRNMVILPYSDRLELLSRYLQQLVMESLGKSGEGITVFGNKGATDQHAFVQQLREGVPNFFVNFLRVMNVGVSDVEFTDGFTADDYLWAFQEGTARALSEAGRCSLRITMDCVTAKSLGALVALYERTVGYYASLIGINAYHQPGVEAGKKVADKVLQVQRAVLEAMAEKPGRTVRELAKEADADIELVYDILTRLTLLKRHGVQPGQPGESPAECAFVRK